MSSLTTSWYIGLDLGKQQDHSAIAVIRSQNNLLTQPDPLTYSRNGGVTLELGYLDRIPLGTDYTSIPRIIHSLILRLEATDLPVHLAVDAGGPGRPVIDLLKRERIPARIHPIVLTGSPLGGKTHRDFETVPRRELIANLRILFKTRLLATAKHMPLANAFEEELAALKFEGGQKQHDDLAIAASLAAWKAKAALRQQRIGA